MKTQNKVQLIGYVGKDPVQTTLPSGTTKVRFRLATHIPVKKDDNETEWRSVWHDVVAWGEKTKTVINEFIKGSHVLVEGSIQYRTYEDKNGHTRYVTEINGRTFVNLDR